MQDLPLLLLASFAFFGLLLIKEKRVLVKSNLALRDYVSSTEDQWSWMSKDGRSYENVEIKRIDQNAILFEHNDGTAFLSIAALSDETRQKLFRTSVWRNREVAVSGQ